jgi:hypothetical protein
MLQQDKDVIAPASIAPFLAGLGGPQPYQGRPGVRAAPRRGADPSFASRPALSQPPESNRHRRGHSADRTPVRPPPHAPAAPPPTARPCHRTPLRPDRTPVRDRSP